MSSDDAKINALQNKQNILPLKRKKKPKLYDSFNDIESTDIDSISGMFFIFKLNYTFLNSCFFNFMF